jgi:hypothetical protein
MSIFETPSWLEAVAPGEWHAVVVERGGEVVARLPYVLKKVGPWRIATNPPLTPRLGPWLRPIPGKEEHRLGLEHELLGQLVDQFPPVDVIAQSLSERSTNWLPFYWRGFSSSVRYTYRIDETSDLDRVWVDFRENIRREIRKASRTLEVRHTDDVELFLATFRSMVARGGWLPRRDDVVRRIVRETGQNDRSRMLLAVDASDRVRACTMLVHDSAFVYYLLGGRNDHDAPTGAPSLLLWEGLKHASEHGLGFDFEGSMIESVERFFRAFGARQIPYLRVMRSSVKGRAFLRLRSAMGRTAL